MPVKRTSRCWTKRNIGYLLTWLISDLKLNAAFLSHFWSSSNELRLVANEAFQVIYYVPMSASENFNWQLLSIVPKSHAWRPYCTRVWNVWSTKLNKLQLVFACHHILSLITPTPLNHYYHPIQWNLFAYFGRNGGWISYLMKSTKNKSMIFWGFMRDMVKK